jgi:hypothetical protein
LDHHALERHRVAFAQAPVGTPDPLGFNRPGGDGVADDRVYLIAVQCAALDQRFDQCVECSGSLLAARSLRRGNISLTPRRLVARRPRSARTLANPQEILDCKRWKKPAG